MADIRWVRRYDSLTRAMETLRRAKALADARSLNELERQGLIQGFEFTHELAWNMLKDYFDAHGVFGIIGSKDATRQAFKSGLVENGETWMAMIGDRNLTSHTYNPELAARIEGDVLRMYLPAFEALLQRMGSLIPNEEE